MIFLAKPPQKVLILTLTKSDSKSFESPIASSDIEEWLGVATLIELPYLNNSNIVSEGEGHGTAEDPYIIQNRLISHQLVLNDFSNCSIIIRKCNIIPMVFLMNCSNIVIMHNYINEEVILRDSFECVIEDNKIIGYNAIILLDFEIMGCYNNTIRNNTIDGISLESDDAIFGNGISLISAINNTLEENTISNINTGIQLMNSSFSIIQDNKIHDCKYIGIKLYASYMNADLWGSNNNLIKNNIIDEIINSEQNQGTGILLTAAKNNTIEYNAITNCYNGIQLGSYDYGDGIYITHNNIWNNDFCGNLNEDIKIINSAENNIIKDNNNCFNDKLPTILLVLLLIVIFAAVFGAVFVIYRKNQNPKIRNPKTGDKENLDLSFTFPKNKDSEII